MPTPILHNGIVTVCFRVLEWNTSPQGDAAGTEHGHFYRPASGGTLSGISYKKAVNQRTSGGALKYQNRFFMDQYY